MWDYTFCPVCGKYLGLFGGLFHCCYPSNDDLIRLDPAGQRNMTLEERYAFMAKMYHLQTQSNGGSDDPHQY